MRLGISSNLGLTNAEEWGQKMSALGCKSVVFPLDCKAPIEQVDAFVAAAKKYDLTIAEVGIWRNAIDADKDKRKANLEYSINQLKLADYIGAKCCVNVSGALMGERWDGPHRANYSMKAWDETVSMAQTVIDAANPTNTYYALEPMPWMIPSNPKEYLALIKLIDRPQFAVHMDIINMICTPKRYFFGDEFMKQCFSLLGPYIKSCHLKDVHLKSDFTFQLEECACGEGEFNLELYAELASCVSGDMPMIIEHLKSDDEYEGSIAYVKNRLSKYIV